MNSSLATPTTPCQGSIYLPEASDHSLQAFIAQVFARVYGARVREFCSHLLGVRNAQGQLVAAAGYNFAQSRRLFLEQYLDEPIEQAASKLLGHAVSRDELVEVGNLAAAGPGGARLLIEAMTCHLHDLGMPWVVFTATRSLVNSFRRLGLQPMELTPALPSRVVNASAWGSYYDTQPVVVLGNIDQGYQALLSRKEALPC